MHERALRTVLLIQAVEESDQPGDVLPLADRAEATRAAIRHEAQTREVPEAGALSPATQRFLARRAERLYERLLARSPVVGHVCALAGGTSWLGRVLFALAFVSGVSLAAFDGSRQINILAFPLIGLIAWNVLVYVTLIVARLRRRSGHPAPRLAGSYERWIQSRVESLLRRSSQFNAPLAAALRRFASEWSSVAHPLIVLRAKRVFHIAAACAALGLIAGLYVRGIVLRYEAGWESTFLEPGGVQVLITMLFGPASALSGIALPSGEDLQALRWEGAPGGGGDAAPWIHLIAITAMLYIVLPRLLAALLASFSLWRLSRHPPVPGSLSAYARAALVESGHAPREVAAVTPYAYEPQPESLKGLRILLATALGGTLELDARDPVRYGDEDTFVEKLTHRATRAADWNVLLMSLGATPEVENHGAVIAGLRDWLGYSDGRAPLLIVIDEASYAARMRGDTSFDTRLAERRRLWQEFVAGYGLQACSIDLAQVAAGNWDEREGRDAVRTALRTVSDGAAAQRKTP